MGFYIYLSKIYNLIKKITMKKIYLLLATTFVAGATFAQLNNNQATILDVKTITKSVGGNKTPTDTVGWTGSSNFLPVFAVGNQVFNYGYSGGGYVYGTNVSTNEINHVAQGYNNLSAASFNVEGVLLGFIGKDYAGTGNGSSVITVNLFNMAANAAYEGTLPNVTQTADGPSGTAIATTTITTADADTNFFSLTYAQFSTPVAVSGDFAASMDANAVKTASDTVGLASDADGEGQRYAFHYVPALTAWIVTADLFNGLNNNIAIFPVIDEGTVGINDKEFYNDMQLSAFPNPANNQATISFRLNKEMSNVNIKMVDLTGKEVLNVNKGTLAAGLYNETVDATNLEAGIYFYSIIANGTRFTKKLTISK